MSKQFDKDELKARLTPLQYSVTQEKDTEKPFTGVYNNHFPGKGIYRCIVCNNPLFAGNTKFESHCGWPAFFSNRQGTLDETPDYSNNKIRTEITCSDCGAHVGHVFKDGPPPTNLRYCVNSASVVYDENEAS